MATTPPADDPVALKHSLRQRVTIALILIGAVLAALAVVEWLSRLETRRPPERPSRPIVSAPPAAPAPKPAAPEVEAKPEVIAVESGQTEATPATDPGGEGVPEASGGLVKKPPPPAAPSPARVSSGATPGSATPTPTPAARTAPPAAVSPPPASSRPNAAPVPAAAPVAAPAAGFVVQLGVFDSPENAEALRAKLSLSGIQTHTETRLQMGPFKTKAEAERAAASVKALGVKGVIVPAR
jgi:DedD protein